jgi:hypothetical protein
MMEAEIGSNDDEGRSAFPAPSAFNPSPARLVYLFGLPPNLSTNGWVS